MAIQTRYAGDALGVNNVDNSAVAKAGVVVATGATKNPIFVTVTNGSATGGNLALETGTGGAVETILRSLQQDSTVIAYQVGTLGSVTTPSQVSIMIEATGAGSSAASSASSEGAQEQTAATIVTALQTRLQALSGGANIGIASNVTASTLTVTNVGLKLATS